jgi:hypothetical protein
MQRLQVVAGIVLLAAAIAWPWLSKLPFGRLPGELRIGREGFGVFFPLAAGLVISALVSLILWWLRG